MLIRVVLPALFSPITPWISPRSAEIHAIIGDKAAIAFDDADGCDLGHERRPGSQGYLALIGSAILIEPSTI
jgi:hypothetical protein